MRLLYSLFDIIARLNSHAICGSTHACAGVFDLGVLQPVCRLVKGPLGLVTLSLWPAGFATRIAIGHWVPTPLSTLPSRLAAIR